MLVVNNALQGILSSFFFKFADTILKKYSSTIATIFTGLMSALMFGHALTLNFCIGVSIVFISMHLFFSLGKYAYYLNVYFKRVYCIVCGIKGIEPVEVVTPLLIFIPSGYSNLLLFFCITGGTKTKEIKSQPRLSVSPSMDHLSLSRVQSAGEFLSAGQESSAVVRPLLPR